MDVDQGRKRDDRVYMAKKGDMVLINVHDLHRTTSSDVAEFERILILFSRIFASDSSEGSPEAIKGIG